ncbi:40236_t:CDS:2, partial [Gigaspora margarita]
MTWIRKVQGILDPNKNQFKASEVSQSEDAITSSELEQQVSDMHN